jgi:hypothetical protein
MTDMPKFAKAKRAVLRALRARGIALVEIAYDGEGDNGQIGHICAFSAKDKKVDIDQPVRLALYDGQKPTRYASLRDALEDSPGSCSITTTAASRTTMAAMVTSPSARPGARSSSATTIA